MDKVKVAIESYQEYRIKEITVDGREMLIPADTLATYFAGLVERFQFVERDPVFRENSSQAEESVSQQQPSQQQQPQPQVQPLQQPVENGGEDSQIAKLEPVQLNASQAPDKEKSRPTLEVVKKNLHNALMEFTVLYDLLTVAKADKWLVLDRAANPETPSESLNALVAAVKRAGLQSAHRHLSHANEQLITAYRQSSHPGSFVNQLIKLRQRWRMRRTAAGVPVGDLSFCSAGSRFYSQRPPTFEVVQLDSSPNEVTDGGIDVTIPPGLDLPVSISLILSDPDDPQLSDVNGGSAFSTAIAKAITLEAKLAQAQQNLFYEELFATMANDALQQRVGDHQVVVSRDSLTCRLCPTSRAVLTITLTRGRKETTDDDLKDKKTSVQAGLSRALLLCSMSLLRKMHNENLQHPTLPTSAPLNVAGSSEKKAILAQVVDQAKYIITRRRLERKLDRLAADVRVNYAARLVVHWSAVTSPTFCTARLTVISPGYDYSRTYSMIIVEIDNVKVVAKDGSVFDVDEELQLLRIHVGELVHDYFVECGQRMAAAAGLVPRNQRSAVGLSSLRLLTVTHPSFSNELCVLLSPDAPPQVRIRNTFYQSVVDRSEQSDSSSQTATLPNNTDSAYINLSFLPGSSFLDKLQNLLSIFSLKP